VRSNDGWRRCVVKEEMKRHRGMRLTNVVQGRERNGGDGGRFLIEDDREGR